MYAMRMLQRMRTRILYANRRISSGIKFAAHRFQLQIGEIIIDFLQVLVLRWHRRSAFSIKAAPPEAFKAIMDKYRVRDRTSIFVSM